jgi:hypothetical protein
LVRVGDEDVARVRDALISEKDRDDERTRSKRERERYIARGINLGGDI